MAVSLPGEILLEILCRLPRKSLCRFEIVSKEWAKLIKEAVSLPAKSTDFGFILQSSGGKKFIEKIIFYRVVPDGALTVEDSISFPSPSRICVIGSYKGVVFYGKYNQFKTAISYHLYNPFTKHHTELPSLTPFKKESRPIGRAFGIAPHPVTNHFKFFVVHNRNGLKVAIFDSETRDWITKPAKISYKYHEMLAYKLCSPGFGSKASALCFEQSLYWVRWPYLVLFCLETETFSCINVPLATTNSNCGVLWESEGRLKYTQICPTDGLCIWVFRGVEKSVRGNWGMIFHISIPTLNSMLAETIKFDPLHQPPSKITRVSAFNEHLQMFHLETYEGVRVCYDIPNRKMTLFSPFAFDEGALLLPFVYCKYDLADLKRIDPGSGRSRKRKFSARQL